MEIIKQPSIKAEPAHQGDINSAATQAPQIKKEQAEEGKEAGEGDSDVEIIESPGYRD